MTKDSAEQRAAKAVKTAIEKLRKKGFVAIGLKFPYDAEKTKKMAAAIGIKVVVTKLPATDPRFRYIFGKAKDRAKIKLLMKVASKR